MKMTEIEPGQQYAIKSTAVRREALRALKADRSLGQLYWDLTTFADPAFPGIVLETGVDCAGRPDGVKARVWKYNEAKNTVLVVHAFEVLKRWDEHELNEEIADRESMLRMADRLEAQAKEIREQWGWHRPVVSPGGGD